MRNPLSNHPALQTALAHAFKHLPTVIGIAVLAGAVYFLWNDFSDLDWAKTWTMVKGISPVSLGIAVFLTFLNFFVLTFYDVVALRHLGYRLRYSKIALTSFIAYVFAGNLGVAILTGGAVRYRFYTRWKVKARHIAHIMVFSAITLGLGLFLVGGIALLFTNAQTFPNLPVSHYLLDFGGLVLLSIVIAYLVLCRLYHKPITFRGVTFSLPPLKLSLAQIAIASLDWIIAAAVLYTLFIGSATAVSFPVGTFFLAFMLAQVVGVNSHVPGGVGVFDGLMLLLLKPLFPLEEILAILLAYRCIYYLMPFTLSLVLFGLMELRYGTRKNKAPKISA